jgi:hypothetical protein
MQWEKKQTSKPGRETDDAQSAPFKDSAAQYFDLCCLRALAAPQWYARGHAVSEGMLWVATRGDKEKAGRRWMKAVWAMESLGMHSCSSFLFHRCLA